jgi:hypothetical protein
MSDKRHERQLKDFFIEIFTEKCVLDDSSITSEEQDSIHSLSFQEILDNLKNVFIELMNFKRNYLNQDKSEVLKTNEKFENMLQKLEAEVRNHIRIEHQLKLHIENSQNHTEELQNFNQQLLSQIKELNEKVKNKPDKKESEKVSKFENLIVKKDAIIAKLEAEVNRLKKEGKENSKGFEGLRQKCEENSSELFKFGMVLKGKENQKVMREKNRNVRKSCVEEMSQSKIKDHKSSVKSLIKVHSRSTSEQVRPSSALRKRN